MKTRDTFSGRCLWMVRLHGVVLGRMTVSGSSRDQE